MSRKARDRTVVVNDSLVSYHFVQNSSHGCCEFYLLTCTYSCLLNFSSFPQSLFQRGSLSSEKEVEGHCRHCHCWRRMRWGQHSLPLGQKWHEGCGAVGEIRANSGIHLARSRFNRVHVFSFHRWQLELQHFSSLYIWCLSLVVQINAWVNLNVILPCFPSITFNLYLFIILYSDFLSHIRYRYINRSVS